MSIPVVAFDEAGNTGANLLDPAQPCFALASVHLSDEEAKAILQPVSGGQAEEAHFASLKRRKAGRKGILKVLQSSLLTEERVKIFLVRKPYLVITKLVDLLVEELVYRQGIDLYERGRNIAVANVLYYGIPACCGKSSFRGLQQSFIDMIRIKSNSAISSFFNAVNSAKQKCSNPRLAIHLHQIGATRGIVQDHLTNWSHTELDPAIPSLLYISSLWSDQFGQPFSIIHDCSKPIAFEKDFVEALMDPDGPDIQVGRDRRVSPLFLKATGISFVDSGDSKQVQVADILAGAASYVGIGSIHAKVNHEFLQGVRVSLRSELIAGGIWPTPKVTPSELGTDIDFKGESEARVGAEIAKRIYFDSQGRPKRRM